MATYKEIEEYVYVNFGYKPKHVGLRMQKKFMVYHQRLQVTEKT